MNINTDESSRECYIINIHIFDNLDSDIDELLWKNVVIYLFIYFYFAFRHENLISDEINDHKILLLCLAIQLQSRHNFVIWKTIYGVTKENVNLCDRMEQHSSGLQLMNRYIVSAYFDQSNCNILFTGIAAFSECMPRGLISLTGSTWIRWRWDELCSRLLCFWLNLKGR